MRRRLTLAARSLRSSSTDAERKLWYCLRAYRLSGAKFRRQHPIGPFVADFACPEAKLVVELDGSQHLDRRDEDRVRTRFLNSRGYVVLRFWNDEVLRHGDVVLGQIVDVLSARICTVTPTLSPGPSPAGGRGELAGDGVSDKAPLAPPVGRGAGGEG